MEEPGREVQAALHPAAVGLHAVASPIEEAGEPQHVVDAGGEARALQALERPEEPEVVVRRELLVERELLRHESEAPLSPGRCRPRGAAPPTLTSPASGGRRPQTIETVVVLPAPFGPEEADDRPLLDPERHAVDGGHAAVGLAQAGHFEGRDHERTRGERFMDSGYGSAAEMFRPALPPIPARWLQACARPLTSEESSTKFLV